MNSARMTKLQLEKQVRAKTLQAQKLRAANKRLEEKVNHLQHSDDMFRLISENAGDLIAVLDLDGRRIYNSPSYASILGNPGKLVGTDSFQEVHPDDRERIRQIFRETVRTGVGHRSDYRFLLKDGSTRFIESLGNMIKDENGHPSKVLVVSRDVTEQQHADRKIRLLAQTVASTKDNVAITDQEGQILFVNDAFLETAGYTQDELVGRHISTVLSTAVIPTYDAVIRPATWAGGWNGIIMGKRKDGTEFPQELWTSLVRSEAGEPVAIVGVTRDITDRLLAENIQRATYRISEATQTKQSFEELLRFIHTTVGDIIPAKNFYIALYDEKQNLLTFPYFVDEYDPSPEPREPGKGLTEYVLRTGEPLLATPTIFEELVANGDVEMLGAPSIDWLGVPLLLKDKTIGVLVVQSYSEGVRFTQKEIEMLSFVSTQVAMSIDRRRGLESLRESEARFRAVFERGGIGMALMDLEGSILETNSSLQVLLGYSADELQGTSVVQILPPEDGEGELLRLSHIAAGFVKDDAITVERRYRHKNGSVVWGRLTRSVIRDAEGGPLFVIGMVEDITMRKRAEERLLKLNECFIQFGPDPVQNINRLTALCGELMGGTTALYNRLAEGVLTAWGKWHVPGDFQSVVTPEGRLCYDVIKGNQKETLVVNDLHLTPYAQTDASILRYKLLTYIGQPVHFGGKVVGALCVLYQHDYHATEDDKRLLGIIAAAISVEEQRKDAAQSLQESEFRFRSLFENANDAIFLMRGEIFTQCNRKTEEIFGCTREEILGRAPFEFSPAFQRDGHPSKVQSRERIQAAIQGVPQHFEWQHSRLDGTLFDAEVSLNPMEIKGEIILQAIVRDITARKLAEESLRESEMRFSILAEAAFEGVGVSDEGKIVLASDQLARMLGYKSGEMTGLSAMNYVAPESQHVVLEKMRAGSMEPYEHIAVRKDGSRFPVEVRARALPFKGNIVRVTAVRDITERKQGEMAIRTAEAKFRALIEHSSEAIGLTDARGVILYESPASTRMLGYEAGELLGRRVFEFLPDDDPGEDVMRLKQLSNSPGATVSGEVMFRHKDGSWRWLDIVGTNLLNEPAVGAIVLNYRDITGRKLAEEQLYRSRQMLQLVLDNIPQRVFWKDRLFNYVGCNRPFAMDAGLSDPSQVKGKHDFELSWKSLAPIYRADDADVMETGTPKMNYEEPLPGPDGSTLWLRSSKIPMLDQEGNVIGVLGTYEDVTERKSAQEELLLEKTRFQQLYENVSLGIAMLDERDRIVDVNPAFTRIFHYTPEEVRDRGIDELLLPPEHLQEGVSLSAEVRHGKPVEREGWRMRKDGSLAYVHIYGVPVGANGGTIGIFGMYEDISERRLAEEKMREQATLLDVSRDAIGVVDLNGKVLYWNKGAESLYGYSSREMLEINAPSLYRQEFIAARQDAMETVMKTGEWSGELRQTTKSGKEVIVQSRWSLVRDNDGQPKSVLVVSTDVTEKKKLEAQFHHAQRLETIGTLAGGIAHDLNNVLAPIMMSIELLQMKITDERSKSLIGTIEASAKRGSDIVKQVLTFARSVEGERILLQPKHLLHDMERIAIETFPKSIEMRSDIPKNLWTIEGDATQLHQVLLNLCINARDAMPQGGILDMRAENLVLTEEEAVIHLNARPGKYVVMSVKDTGLGIPSEIMEKIFDPFFTTKEVGKGTGLGLSTALGIVESHRGFITATSEWGKGAEFKVYLPALGEIAVENRPETPVDLPRGNNEYLLIVDDEAPIREILKESLESYGYRVLEAKDGMEAAVVYEKNRSEIKLVLTDMMMPTMDGPAVIRLLRRMNPSLKIIVVSGMADEEQLTEGLRKNIQGFLQKPFSAEKLLKTIDTVLKGEKTDG